jgi:hypothetical protein
MLLTFVTRQARCNQLKKLNLLIPMEIGVKWCPVSDSNQGHADFQSTADRVETTSYAEKSVKPLHGNQILSGVLSNSAVGPTGLCHASSEAIGEAAAWYAGGPDHCERPVVPALRKRFGLTPHEAVIALREAGRILRQPT